MSQSLRVPVEVLIANAEAERSRIVAEHAKAKRAAVSMTVAQARLQLTRQLRSLAKDIDRGAVNPRPSSGWSDKRKGYVPHISVRVSVEMPPKLAPKPDTAKVDRALRLLRATSQSTVAVHAGSDFSAYLP